MTKGGGIVVGVGGIVVGVAVGVGEGDGVGVIVGDGKGVGEGGVPVGVGGGGSKVGTERAKGEALHSSVMVTAVIHPPGHGPCIVKVK